MKITTTEVNVATGEVIVKEVELTPQQEAEMLEQQRVSEIQNRMSEILAELQSMDYKTSKHADGEYTDAQWKKIVDVRKALREEYRALEAELDA
jgi:hypothetical protein